MFHREFWHRHWERIAIGAIVLLLLGTAVKAAVKIEKPGRTGAITRTALLRWQPQIRHLHAGGDPYRDCAYPNPPILALLLTPFLLLTPAAATLTWFALKIGMAAMMAVWCRRLIGVENVPRPVLLIGVLLGLPPILGDLSHGNVNLLIAFLVVAGLELFRRKHDMAAGLFFALAIACKVTPLLFVPYFVWKRAWRTVAGIVVGLVLFWWLVPGFAFGFDRSADLFASWYGTMVKPFVIDGHVTSVHANQSLPGLLTRLFTESESFTDYAADDGHIYPTESHTLLNLGPAAVQVILKVLMLGFVGMMALVMTRGAHSPRQGVRFAAEVSLVLLGMLLFSERTWKHHAVTLILPCTVLAAAWWQTRRSVPGAMLTVLSEHVERTNSQTCSRKAVSMAPILLFVAVIAVIPGLLPARAQDLLMVYGTYTLMYLVVAAGVLFTMRFGPPMTTRPQVTLRRLRRPAPTSWQTPRRSVPAA